MADFFCSQLNISCGPNSSIDRAICLTSLLGRKFEYQTEATFRYTIPLGQHVFERIDIEAQMQTAEALTAVQSV